METYLEQLRQLDPEARVYLYLDDTYVVVDKANAALAFAGLALWA